MAYSNLGSLANHGQPQRAIHRPPVQVQQVQEMLHQCQAWDMAEEKHASTNIQRPHRAQKLAQSATPTSCINTRHGMGEQDSL